MPDPENDLLRLRARLGPVLAASLLLVCMAVPVTALAQSDDRVVVERFDLTGDNPLSDRVGRSILDEFTGRAADLDDLRRAAQALETGLHDRGYAFYRVSIPPQTIDDGVVELRVVRFEISEVAISGNEHYAEAAVLHSLPPVRVGASPNVREVTRAIEFANLHPGRTSAVTFSAEGESLVASVRVDDERPTQAFAWTNNTGSEDTGETRLGVGIQYANLFRRDHLLSASYTTATRDPDNVSQYALNYRVPLYRLSSSVDLYLLRSDVDAGVVSDFFEVRGRGRVRGARYTHHLARRGNVRQSVFFGIDDKLFENDITFNGQPIGVSVRSRPASLGYRYQWLSERVAFIAHAAYYANLTGGEFNDDDTYALSRAGASRDWWLARYGVSI